MILMIEKQFWVNPVHLSLNVIQIGKNPILLQTCTNIRGFEDFEKKDAKQWVEAKNLLEKRMFFKFLWNMEQLKTNRTPSEIQEINWGRIGSEEKKKRMMIKLGADLQSLSSWSSSLYWSSHVFGLERIEIKFYLIFKQKGSQNKLMRIFLAEKKTKSEGFAIWVA